MMRNAIPFLALVGTIACSACGSTEVTINLEGVAGGNYLEIQLLPFDRDAIIDSLTGEAAEPEPQIPAQLLEVSNRVVEAEVEWRWLEWEWARVRDELYPEHLPWEYTHPRLVAVERRRDSAFERYASVQDSMRAQAAPVRTLREMWRNEAFADYDVVAQFKTDMSGLDPVVDTTDCSGSVVLKVPVGQYWVHARLERLDVDEFYWNVPLAVEGDPVTLTLDASNAQVRLTL